MPRYKRPYDLTVLILAHALLLPVWLLLWTLIPLLILLFDGRPVLYRQRRLGREGREFHIIKFRTMIRDAERHVGPVWAAVNDSRVTRLGRVLRTTRLDELPQVINVLRGEMSIVGPRPERPEFVQRFVQEMPGFELRMQVLPGIAGLAHVRGDSYTTPGNRLRYDMFYISRMNPWLDTVIISQSVWLVTRQCFGGVARAGRSRGPS